MPNLDYDAFRAFLKRHHDTEPERAARLVGRDRTYDSGYFDIRRFCGPLAIDPRTVGLEYRTDPFRLGDPLVETFARCIESRFRSEGRLYEGPMIMAVSEGHFDAPHPRLIVQPCDYGLFAGSCFALDLPDDTFAAEGGTLREYRRVHRTTLPPGLGVSGLLVTTEPDGSRHVLVVIRAAHLASLSASVGPSAAGSVDFGQKWPNVEVVTREAMAAEISEELGLSADEYTITPLAYAREMFRGDKPQLFCRIDTPLSSAEVTTRIAAVAARPEFTDFAFLPLDRTGRLSPSDVARINHEAVTNYFVMEEHW